MAEIDLFPDPQRIIKLRDAIRDCDVSGLPSFDDKYARLWPKIPVPRGKRLKSSAYQIIGKGYNSCIKPNPDMPCCSLPKFQTGRGFATITHWQIPRALSVGEAKRISSFPDPFQLIGDYQTQWAQIGNAVPPLFVRAIASNLKNVLLQKKTRCQTETVMNTLTS